MTIMISLGNLLNKKNDALESAPQKDETQSSSQYQSINKNSIGSTLDSLIE
jgi:hypothetical protein